MIWRVLIELSNKNYLFRDPYDGLIYSEGDESSVPPNSIMRHILPQCCFIYNNGRIALDKIFLIDDMPQVQDMLTRSFGLASPIPWRMVGSMRKELRCRISEPTQLLIRSIYRHDQKLVEAIGDNKATPLGSQDFPKVPSVQIAGTGLSRIPRILWMFWHQGVENAPKIVKNCIQNWMNKNRNWDIRVLDHNTAATICSLPEWYSTLDVPLATYSDILRIHLLQRYGGVWADATTWCVCPLDDWIDQVTQRQGFFAYATPAPDRPLASWFLAAREHNFIVERWTARVDEMWRSTGTLTNGELTDEPDSREYFWFHKLFAALIRSEEEVARAWNSVPQISADAPHHLQRIGLLEKINNEAQFHIANKLTNIYKLDRRLDIPDDVNGTIIGLLFKELARSSA